MVCQGQRKSDYTRGIWTEKYASKVFGKRVRKAVMLLWESVSVPLTDDKNNRPHILNGENDSRPEK